MSPKSVSRQYLIKGRAIGLNVVDAREWLKWTARENWKGFTMVSSDPKFAVEWLSSGIKRELEIQALNAGRVRYTSLQTKAKATEPATCRIINKYHMMNLARDPGLGIDDACISRTKYVWQMVLVGPQQYRFYDSNGRVFIPPKQVDKTREQSVVIFNHELEGDKEIWNVVPFEGGKFYTISSCRLDAL